MGNFRRILLAVRDPGARRQPGVEKAAALARSLDASLELFHAIASPVFVDLQPLAGKSLDDLRRETQQRLEGRLRKIASTAQRGGLSVTSSVAWDHPPHEAIIRRASRIGADLIVAECHHAKTRRPWLMRLTDWELLRQSDLPVLLLKGGKRPTRPVILAAVDPSHAHAKPLDLDDRILSTASEMADALKGSVHVGHANHPSPLALTMVDPMLDTQVLGIAYEQLTRSSRKTFADFATAHGIHARKRHLVDGSPETVIPRLAKKLRAGMVVMGAVSRSGLKRVFIGNTAERVLDALPCDVLVLKPGSFRKRVKGRSRGMNVAVAPSVLSLPV